MMTGKLCMPLAAAAAVLAAGVTSGQPNAEESLQEGDLFPDLATESLAESRVELPRALQGDAAIVIVTFSKKGGEAAADWTAAIRERFPGQAAPDIWLAMVLDGVPGLLRGFVVGGIKRGIPDAMHPRALTLHEDGDLWRRRCAVQSDDTPCVMLLDAGNHIRWIRTDTATDAHVADLERRVRALLPAADAQVGGDRAVEAPQGSFSSALDAHLQAIQDRDLEALLDTITTGEDLVLIFPDGTRTNTREEYVAFHESWFADPEWRMHMNVLHVIERPELGHALMKYRYESTTDAGEPRTSVNYVAMTFAKEDGEWRLVFDQNTRIKVLVGQVEQGR